MNGDFFSLTFRGISLLRCTTWNPITFYSTHISFVIKRGSETFSESGKRKILFFKEPKWKFHFSTCPTRFSFFRNKFWIRWCRDVKMQIRILVWRNKAWKAQQRVSIPIAHFTFAKKERSLEILWNFMRIYFSKFLSKNETFRMKRFQLYIRDVFRKLWNEHFYGFEIWKQRNLYSSQPRSNRECALVN